MGLVFDVVAGAILLIIELLYTLMIIDNKSFTLFIYMGAATGLKLGGGAKTIFELDS